MTQLTQISSKNEYSFKSNVNALDTIEDLLVKDMCEAIMVSTYTLPQLACVKCKFSKALFLLLASNFGPSANIPSSCKLLQSDIFCNTILKSSFLMLRDNLQ